MLTSKFEVMRRAGKIHEHIHQAVVTPTTEGDTNFTLYYPKLIGKN